MQSFFENTFNGICNSINYRMDLLFLISYMVIVCAFSYFSTKNKRGKNIKERKDIINYFVSISRITKDEVEDRLEKICDDNCLNLNSLDKKYIPLLKREFLNKGGKIKTFVYKKNERIEKCKKEATDYNYKLYKAMINIALFVLHTLLLILLAFNYNINNVIYFLIISFIIFFAAHEIKKYNYILYTGKIKRYFKELAFLVALQTGIEQESAYRKLLSIRKNIEKYNFENDTTEKIVEDFNKKFVK